MQIFRSGLLCCTFASLFIVFAAQSGDFPNRATGLLVELKEGTTLSEWMRAHPADTLVLYSFRYRDWNGNWVARATRRESLSDGRELVRHAYFYAPLTPHDRKLPRLSNEKKLRGQSRLGLIWVQANESDVETGEKLAEPIRAVLSERFGQGEYDLKISYANAAYWSKTARWKVGPATLVSAYESTPGGTPNNRRLLAFGFLPVAGVHVDLGGGDDIYEEDFRADMNLLDAAIAASGLGGKHLESMRFVKEKVAEYHSGQSQQWKGAVDQKIVVALKQWLADSKALRGVKRAAALLAADRALQLSEQFVHPENESIRERLKALGAAFNYSQLGGAYVYTNNWLKMALRIDHHGPIGNQALLVLMKDGFDTSGTCADTGYEGFRRVIAEGERFLGRTRNPELRKRAHLLVAEAYSDIVALADGAGEGYANASRYRKAAGKARVKAIAHYRQALLLAIDRLSSVGAWREAWRLMAGAPPSNTHFFCVYD
jgi:hypothetical protein